MAKIMANSCEGRWGGVGGERGKAKTERHKVSCICQQPSKALPVRHSPCPAASGALRGPFHPPGQAVAKLFCFSEIIPPLLPLPPTPLRLWLRQQPGIVPEPPWRRGAPRSLLRTASPLPAPGTARPLWALLGSSARSPLLCPGQGAGESVWPCPSSAAGTSLLGWYHPGGSPFLRHITKEPGTSAG